MATYNYNNRVSGFVRDTKSLVVVVYDASDNLMDLTSYDGSLYMQKYPIQAGSTPDLALSHFAKDSSSMLFKLSSVDTSLANGDYLYEVIIDDGTNRYTVVQDTYNLNKSII